MRSLSEIIRDNNNATEIEKNNNTMPYVAKSNGDKNVFGCDYIGNYIPDGWEVSQKFFVDASGWGRENEMALTPGIFLRKVKKGLGYAITEKGQFQVYITEFKKI